MKTTLIITFITIFQINAQSDSNLINHYEAYRVQMQQQGDIQGIINAMTHLIVLEPNVSRKDTLAAIYMNEENKIYISLPGVPYEMKGIMQEYVFPKLLSKIGGEKLVLNKTIRTHGMGESFLAEIIKSLL